MLKNVRQKPETETCSIICQLFISRAAINPRMPLLWNTTCSEELNAHPSPSLDHISADSDTSELHLGFTSLNNGAKRSLERSETEGAI